MKCFTLFITFVSLFFLTSSSQTNNTADIAFDIVKTAEKLHYSPPVIDVTFSKKVAELFIDKLDPNSLYLLKEDVELLKKEALNIHTEITSRKIDFLTSSTEIFETRITTIISFLKQLKATNLVFNEKENISLEKQTPKTSLNELKNKWKNIVEYDFLADYRFTNQEAPLNEAAFKQFISQQFTSQIGQIICQIEEKYFKEGKLTDFVHSKYLNAIAASFDPHTAYFSPSANESFTQQLSKETLSFGMYLEKNQDGNFELLQLIPGGPAWNSALLNEGDVLTQLKDGKGVPIDLKCITQYAFNKLLNDLDSATFTFKKSSGKKVILATKKQSIEVVENIIDSYVLAGEQNIGYLYLPSFYTEENNGIQLPNGCANDIAKQLLKLKREGIEGLIIDLRDNGGGSMLEAIRLAGIFINFGAVAITDRRNEEPTTLKDLDRGMIFSKPLVILVNGHSASASEFFAATMQDHNRGLIVGENTFGKSTFQQVLPVDAHKRSEHDQSESDKGYLKLTLGKFFRVTGKSHQGKGVKVDIPLSNNSRGAFHESDLPNALPNTSIIKKTYYTALPEIPIAQLTSLRENRNKNITLPTYQKEPTSIPLDFKNFNIFFDSFDIELPDYRHDTTKNYRATIPSFFFEEEGLTQTEKTLQDLTINSIERDEYIIESYLILADLIKLKK